MSTDAELPRIPGSVVSATLSHNGKTGRRILLRRAYPGKYPWVSEQDVCDKAYWADDELRRVRVIFERQGETDD